MYCVGEYVSHSFCADNEKHSNIMEITSRSQ